jgi:chaperonin cofactor prefoldin
MSDVITTVDGALNKLKNLEQEIQSTKLTKKDIKDKVKVVCNTLKKDLKSFEESDVKSVSHHFEKGIEGLWDMVSINISKAQKEILSKFEKKVNVNTKVNELLTERVKSLKLKIRESNSNQTFDKSQINSLMAKIKESFSSMENSV